jgi:hypothetical protein
MSVVSPCNKLPQALLLGTAFLSMLAATPARADVHKFTISDLVCKYLACETMDTQEGLTTLDVEGEDFQEWAGNNLVFRVYRLVDQNHADVVIDSKVDVTAKGHLETRIPVYNLSDGNYYLAFYSAASRSKPIAVGIFTRTTDATVSRQSGEEIRQVPAREQKTK